MAQCAWYKPYQIVLIINLRNLVDKILECLKRQSIVMVFVLYYEITVSLLLMMVDDL